MLITAQILLVLFAILSLKTLIWTFRCVAVFRKYRPPQEADSELPKARVILAVRGADPFLPDCIRGLLNQDYPDYDVRIVVDSRGDPAWSVVAEVVRQMGAEHVQVAPLRDKLETCSLRASAVAQAIEDLDDSYGAIAILDADVIPYPDWLRNLAVPLCDETVGAATGVRWYLPSKRTLSNLIRYFWNSGSIPEMVFHQIAWGGSLAIRTDVLKRTDLRERWRQSLFDDTQMKRSLRQVGLELQHVPRVVAMNRETIEFRDCMAFITRQMLNTRLYHSSWPYLFIEGLFSAAAGIVTLGLLIGACLLRDWSVFAWATAGWSLLFVSNGVAHCWREHWVIKDAVKRGESIRLMGPLDMCRCVFTAVIIHLMFAVCLCGAELTKRVTWRGITYDIQGAWSVHMRNYQPYQAAQDTTDGLTSL